MKAIIDWGLLCVVEFKTCGYILGIVLSYGIP